MDGLAGRSHRLEGLHLTASSRGETLGLPRLVSQTKIGFRRPRWGGGQFWVQTTPYDAGTARWLGLDLYPHLFP